MMKFNAHMVSPFRLPQPDLDTICRLGDQQWRFPLQVYFEHVGHPAILEDVCPEIIFKQ